MTDPVDDFARGPEVTPSCGNIFADLGLPDAEELMLRAVILSVLKPFAEHMRSVPDWVPDDTDATPHEIGEYRRARDLYLKLGGVL